MGFRLVMNKSGSGHEQWKAQKTVDGKQRTIYVGKDPCKAEEKIAAYLGKYSPNE